MNKKLIFRIVGLILCIEALCLLPPLLYTLVCGGEDLRAFFHSVLICALVGAPLALIRSEDRRLQTRDGFVCVALCWIALGLFGALPYYLGGCCGYIDAFFETVSGLTTTGASVFSSPETLPRGILLWRSMTQWMGGMGVLVLMLALIPKLSDGSVNLMKAESPGPISSKLRPKTGETARTLYLIYIYLTLAEILLLRLAGMPWYDAVNTSLATISTGGFSIRNASISYYGSELINWILVFFMFVSSVNFSLLFLAYKRKWRDVARSDELRFFSGTVLVSTLLITADLVFERGYGLYQSFSQAAFQVVTLVSTTGFYTADYDLWPKFSEAIILLVMFAGGCAGSTAGGIKASRFVVLFKGLRRELRRILHSREVRPITLDGQRVEEGTVSAVSMFFFIYVIIILVCTAVVSLDGVDMVTSQSAALTSISNVGPALSLAGPTRNFAFFSARSKLVLAFTMLLGRLEIMPLLVLFMPSLWRRK